jgi:hypothetical protein
MHMIEGDLGNLMQRSRLSGAPTETLMDAMAELVPEEEEIIRTWTWQNPEKKGHLGCACVCGPCAAIMRLGTIIHPWQRNATLPLRSPPEDIAPPQRRVRKRQTLARCNIKVACGSHQEWNGKWQVPVKNWLLQMLKGECAVFDFGREPV